MAVSLTDEQVREVRARILHIAEQRLAADGVGGLSLRTIASEMGWTAASLYRYFSSKAELVASARAAAYTRFSARIGAAEASSKDLWDRSRAIGEAYVTFAREEPDAYKLIFAHEQPDAEKTEELRLAEAASRRMMTAYAEDMVEAGLLEGDPVVLGHVYWASLHGLLTLEMAGKLGAFPDFDLVRHASNRLITRGAQPRPKGADPSAAAVANGRDD